MIYDKEEWSQPSTPDSIFSWRPDNSGSPASTVDPHNLLVRHGTGLVVFEPEAEETVADGPCIFCNSSSNSRLQGDQIQTSSGSETSYQTMLEQPRKAELKDETRVSPKAAKHKFSCQVLECPRSYSKPGQLRRHMKDHSAKRYYCADPMCPRGLASKGWPRRDKLVDHLFKRHKYERPEANLIAALQDV